MLRGPSSAREGVAVSRPEDTGSRTVADAAAYERWRAKGDPAPDEDERDYETVYRVSPRVLSGCRCHSASEEPCDWCSEPNDPPEPIKPRRNA